MLTPLLACHRHVREDRVLEDGGHGHGVARPARARRHAEEPVL